MVQFYHVIATSLHIHNTVFHYMLVLNMTPFCTFFSFQRNASTVLCEKKL